MDGVSIWNKVARVGRTDGVLSWYIWRYVPNIRHRFYHSYLARHDGIESLVVPSSGMLGIGHDMFCGMRSGRQYLTGPRKHFGEKYFV